MCLGRMDTAAACTAGTPGARSSRNDTGSAPPLIFSYWVTESALSLSPPYHHHLSVSPSLSGPRPGGSCVAGC